MPPCCLFSCLQGLKNPEMRDLLAPYKTPPGSPFRTRSNHPSPASSALEALESALRATMASPAAASQPARLGPFARFRARDRLPGHRRADGPHAERKGLAALEHQLSRRRPAARRGRAPAARPGGVRDAQPPAHCEHLAPSWHARGAAPIYNDVQKAHLGRTMSMSDARDVFRCRVQACTASVYRKLVQTGVGQEHKSFL